MALIQRSKLSTKLANFQLSLFGMTRAGARFAPVSKVPVYFTARPGRKRHNNRNPLRTTSGHPLAILLAYMRID